MLAHGDLCPMESHQDVKWAQLAGRGVRALAGGSEIWSEEKTGLWVDGVDRAPQPEMLCLWGPGDQGARGSRDWGIVEGVGQLQR